MFDQKLISADLIIPKEWNRWCWERWTCQQAGHVAVHAGLTVVLDRLGLSPTEAKLVSLGAAVAIETADVLTSMSECGRTACSRYGPSDPFLDLGFRAAGALLVGPLLNRLLGGN